MQKSYNDERFTKLSLKLNSMYKNKSSLDLDQRDYETKTPARESNKGLNLVESLEDSMYRLAKDHRLKYNLLKDDLEYLEKLIQSERELSNMIQNQILSDIKQTESKLSDIISYEETRSKELILKKFNPIGNQIEELNTLSQDNQILAHKETLALELNQLNLNLQNNEIHKNKEFGELVHEVNTRIKDANRAIQGEKARNETNEKIILEKIEQSLSVFKDLKQKHMQDRESFEEGVFSSIEDLTVRLIENLSK